MRPRTVTVTDTVNEGPGIKTLLFDESFDIEPGMYGMFWVYGVDEVPMSYSYPNGITIRDVGETTHALMEMEPGAKLGVRGPFGSSFTSPSKDESLVVVGGGTGMAPAALQAENAAQIGADVTVLIGARSREELIFMDRLDGVANVKAATEDGSAGHQGLVTDLLESHGDVDMVAGCGPDGMLGAILRHYSGTDVEVEVSVERYMKCGIGLCGSCCIDDSGEPVCSVGPVFQGERIVDSEVGVYHRDAAGRKEHLDGR